MLVRLSCPTSKESGPGTACLYIEPAEVVSIVRAGTGGASWLNLRSGRKLIVDGEPDDVHALLCASK